MTMSPRWVSGGALATQRPGLPLFQRWLGIGLHCTAAEPAASTDTLPMGAATERLGVGAAVLGDLARAKVKGFLHRECKAAPTWRPAMGRIPLAQPVAHHEKPQTSNASPTWTAPPAAAHRKTFHVPQLQRDRCSRGLMGMQRRDGGPSSS